MLPGKEFIDELLIVMELVGEERLMVDHWIQALFCSTGTSVMVADRGTPPVEVLMLGAGVKQPSWLSMCCWGASMKQTQRLFWFGSPGRTGVLCFSSVEIFNGGPGGGAPPSLQFACERPL